MKSLKRVAAMARINARRRAVSTGLKGTRVWRIWTGMRTRCNNPNNADYAAYGASGIKVCERWAHFKNFWEDMKRGYSDTLQLDRVDGTKGYSKDNCRWATPEQQQRNRRSNRVVDTPKGRMLLIEASEAFGIPYGCLKMRARHWPAERLFEPKRSHVRKCILLLNLTK